MYTSILLYAEKDTSKMQSCQNNICIHIQKCTDLLSVHPHLSHFDLTINRTYIVFMNHSGQNIADLPMDCVLMETTYSIKTVFILCGKKMVNMHVLTISNSNQSVGIRLCGI